MRQLDETSYMFTEPFVMDSIASEERLGLAPSPMTDGMARTVVWWRAQERAVA